jgi:prepilin-type N-terminal cleavage/methylation domain-containing protein
LKGHAQGFTLIELLVVVAIIGIIASIAVVAFQNAILDAKVTTVATDLRAFESGFVNYSTDQGDLPPDSHLDPPYHLPAGAGVEDYLPVQRWVSPTPLGGNYNWEGPDNYPYAGISFFGTTTLASTMAMLDEKIDDGNLSQGRFRVTPNGRYTYILEE